MSERGRKAPRLGLGVAEGRLYLVAGLAGIYLLAWRGVTGAPRPAAAPPIAEVSEPTTAAPRWIDEVPLAERPTVAIPPGWHATGRQGDVAAAPPVRVVRARPRVRTRSS
jgi:hypothetical protein